MAAALAAGVTLAGRYRLTRVLGRGALAEVWLADDLAEGRPVALKFPGEAPGALQLLRAGYEQARTLVHPGIVRLHDLVEGPPTFLVMQYVEGRSIGVLRGAGWRTVLSALVQVADALEHAHRRRVVHRDLKASNVLCDEAGRCTIVDFGMGALGAGGTLPSMSPQQLAGEPPSVADDVYAFGALAFDLLTGQPLFHPDVTPGRVASEMPAIPLVDLTGEPLPDGLRRLLGSLLQKSAALRPPGMAAVRSAIEDVLRENPATPGVVRPLGRVSAAAGGAPPARARTRSNGLRASVFYGALTLVLALAAAVIFYLPAVVRERGVSAPAVPPPSPVQSAPAGASGSAPSAVPQELLDQALGEFLQADDALRERNAEVWGAAEWAEMRRHAAAGDAAYQRRDAAAALASYRQAGALAKDLIARAPELAAAALREGEAALKARDQPRAIAALERALAIEPDNDAARRHLERARRLDRVLALIGEASAAEAAGSRTEALRLYRAAAELDPEWPEARAGMQRLAVALARDAYEAAMARGFAAQAAGDLGAAHAAFEDALRARPGDAQARAALAQIETDRQLARLTALQFEARALEEAERWTEAAKRYEKLLAADANLAEARAGRERALARADLDERLRREIDNADRFNDDAVVARARAVLEAAQAVPGPGPVLARQIAELDELLRIAMTPVPVTLASDNQTQVTLYKVGRLGAFTHKTLELRPGAYTAVGSRPGYRDVRRNFRVSPGATDAPVVVVCEEPI